MKNKAIINAAPRYSFSTSIKGFSLIELMVSMVIGLFLVLGATTLYVKSRKTSDVDDSVALLQETARYAMSVIETDVRMANYWGLVKDGAAIINKPTQLNPPTSSGSLVASNGANSCGATYAIDVEKYTQGSNDSYSFACGPNSTAVASADTLTVRRASTTVESAVSATTLQICSNRDVAEIILGNKPCADETHNLIVNGYYVDQASDQSSTLPSLRRKTLITGPAFQDVEIIAGIEDMQVQFGIESTNDPSTSAFGGAATRYVNPDDAALTPTPPAATHVVAVRVWLLVRSNSLDQTYTDSNIYEYGNRDAGAGKTNTVSDLNSAGSSGKAYKPGDHYRRLLVSRTFFVRNVVGT